MVAWPVPWWPVSLPVSLSVPLRASIGLCEPACWPVVGLIEGIRAHPSMVSLSRGAGRGYCRVAVLPVFHRATADLPGLSPRVRGNRTIRILSFYVSGSPGFVFLNRLSLATDDCRSVLAVKGSLRRFAPWIAPGRSEGMTVYEGKGGGRANVAGCAVFQDSNVRSLLFQPLRGGG